MLNPTLSDLIGGIESVTLSDEEARRRGTQKTVLERRAPPTFDVVIEIEQRDTFIVHPDVSTAVDELVRGYPLQPELRQRREDGTFSIEKTRIAPSDGNRTQGFSRNGAGRGARPAAAPAQRSTPVHISDQGAPASQSAPKKKGGSKSALKPIHIYAYGVARNRLAQAAQQLGVPAVLTRHVEEAEVFITLRSYYRSRQQAVMDAESSGMPIYILRANTIAQMEKALVEMFNLSYVDFTLPNEEDVMQMTENAIKSVLNGESWVDLPPAPANIRRIQHEMARQAELVSHSYGQEPNRRVRIFRN